MPPACGLPTSSSAPPPRFVDALAGPRPRPRRVRPRSDPGAPTALELPLPGSIRVCTAEGRAQDFEFGTVAGEGVTQVGSELLAVLLGILSAAAAVGSDSSHRRQADSVRPV